MIFRRRSKRDSDQPDDVYDDENAYDEDEAYDDEADDDEEDEFDELDRIVVPRPNGPWDRSETTADSGDAAYVDLGGLVVHGVDGLELRLQVENQQGSVASVMLAGADSGLELRAFAAPRSAGIWDDVRADISAEATKRGGTAQEADGEFGTELVISVPLQAPDGRSATQVSRIVGVEGPRWLLRGTFLGRSATDPDPEGLVETAFRQVIVVRGDEAMAPRDLIPMHMPAAAQPGDALAGESDVEPTDDEIDEDDFDDEDSVDEDGWAHGDPYE